MVKIHYHHIGHELLYFSNRIPAIACFPADLAPGMVFENSVQQLTNGTIVVRDENSRRHKLTKLLV